MLLALFVSTALARVDAFPSFVHFSDTIVNSRSISQTITVTNRGPNRISSLFVSSSCGIDFDVQKFGCFGPLDLYQSCRMSVSFSPRFEGYRTCSLSITGDGSSETVTLSGRGVKPR